LCFRQQGWCFFEQSGGYPHYTLCTCQSQKFSATARLSSFIPSLSCRLISFTSLIIILHDWILLW
jgi:hypothetical protein